MLTFGGLTKHFLMILMEYFLMIYKMTNNMILEAIMKKVSMKTKIKKQHVTLDLVLNAGSDIHFFL